MRYKASFAHHVIPAKENTPERYEGGPAGHAVPPGWQISERLSFGDNVVYEREQASVR